MERTLVLIKPDAMQRGLATEILGRLERRGLTERVAETARDRRFRAAALTSTGSALVPELAAVADANDAAFFGHLGREERGRIEHLLRDILARHGETRRPVE
jgi:DNA-binding MarR family transcriptional regulator